MKSIPRAQEIYKHFKGNVYQIITIAEHSETGEKMVIYQAMYGEFKVYARPLAMFMEKVDKQKYPDVKQEYRFEKVEPAGMVCEKPVEISRPAKEEGASSQQKVTQETSEEELQLDPLLLDFLDADTYEEKLNILSAVHSRITDDMITTMAIACDVEVAEGDLEVRYNQLRSCLLTLDRYEINRVR